MSHEQNLPTRASVISKTGYEAKVIWQALKRAGRNVNLKGHIHEVLVRDRFNLRPARLLDRKTARLVANPTAKVVDVIVLKSGRAVSRLQLKDTPRSIPKLVAQINRGQYRTAQVLATDETVIEFNKAVGRLKGAKVVKPSGVSSRYTSALARRAGAAGAGNIVRSAAHAARVGGVWGAITCGVIAVITALCDLARRKRSFRSACRHVALETAGGGVAGAAAGVSATLSGAGIAVLFAAVGFSGLFATLCIVLAPLIISVAVGVTVKNVFDRLVRRRGVTNGREH